MKYFSTFAKLCTGRSLYSPYSKTRNPASTDRENCGFVTVPRTHHITSPMAIPEKTFKVKYKHSHCEIVMFRVQVLKLGRDCNAAPKSHFPFSISETASGKALKSSVHKTDPRARIKSLDMPKPIRPPGQLLTTLQSPFLRSSKKPSTITMIPPTNIKSAGAKPSQSSKP